MAMVVATNIGMEDTQTPLIVMALLTPDAATAIPLGIAFLLARKQPNKRFTFGYGRVEDLAGVIIVFVILFSAIVAGYESINRFFHPHDISHLWAVAIASGLGFLGNEAVAIFRIRVGRRIGSAALIADGQHARIDGWTSLAVRHQLLHHLKYLSLVVIHVDPEEKSGEYHHRIEMHSHNGLPAHSHA